MFSEEIKNIKSGKKELREFGLTIGIILVILGSVALWRSKPIFPYFLSVGIIFVTLGLASPNILKPFQRAWMTFSIIIGFFMSRLILTILFYLVITPIGTLAKIFGKDILDQRIDRKSESYWKERTVTVKKESYENQY